MVVIQFTQTENQKVVRRSKSFNFDKIRVHNSQLIGTKRQEEEYTIAWINVADAEGLFWIIIVGSDHSHWNGWEIV